MPLVPYRQVGKKARHSTNRGQMCYYSCFSWVWAHVKVLKRDSGLTHQRPSPHNDAYCRRCVHIEDNRKRCFDALHMPPVCVSIELWSEMKNTSYSYTYCFTCSQTAGSLLLVIANVAVMFPWLHQKKRLTVYLCPSTKVHVVDNQLATLISLCIPNHCIEMKAYEHHGKMWI